MEGRGHTYGVDSSEEEDVWFVYSTKRASPYKIALTKKLNGSGFEIFPTRRPRLSPKLGGIFSSKGEALRTLLRFLNTTEETREAHLLYYNVRRGRL